MMLRWTYLALCLSAGCASVAPWERETLAEDRMQLDPDPDATAMVDGRRALREEGHVGAGRSATGAAGGCGCN